MYHTHLIAGLTFDFGLTWYPYSRKTNPISLLLKCIHTSYVKFNILRNASQRLTIISTITYKISLKYIERKSAFL